MYNNQDVKPFLPSLNYPNQQQSSYLPLPYNKGIPGLNGVYASPPPNMVTNNYQPNGNLPPIQFYSTKDNVPHYEGHDVNYQVNYPPVVNYTNYYMPQRNASGGSASEDEKYNIDYSSIISFTNSPSLKRKRRNKLTSNINVNTNTGTVNTRTSDLLSVEEIAKLTCTVCGKGFAKQYNLKSHMKSHSSVRPFKCSICSKTFARGHDKKRHELLHNGQRNFKCEGVLKDGKTKWGCGKKFARSDALSRHFRTETGWLCIKPLMDEAKNP